jgi:hypothetical protein
LVELMHRIIGQVGVARCRLRLRVAEQLADHRQRGAGCRYASGGGRLAQLG